MIRHIGSLVLVSTLTFLLGCSPNESNIYNDSYPPQIREVTPNYGSSFTENEITIKSDVNDKYGFKKGVSVYIDDLPCSNVKVISRNEIKCRTPINSRQGVASVRVKNLNSYETTFQNAFEYVPSTRIMLQGQVATADQNSSTHELTFTGQGISDQAEIRVGSYRCIPQELTDLEYTTRIHAQPIRFYRRVRCTVQNVNQQHFFVGLETTIHEPNRKQLTSRTLTYLNRPELLNARGFRVNGIHRNGTRYDDRGYDFDGYNRSGFSETGMTRNGTPFDSSGRNAQGIYQEDVGVGRRVIRDLNQFLMLARPALGNDYLMPRPQSRQQFARAILNRLPEFWRFNPSYEQVMQLLQQNGGVEGDQLELTMVLKSGLFERGLVNSLQRLINVSLLIYPDAQRSAEYIRRNTAFVTQRLTQYMNEPVRTLVELRALHRALADGRFDAGLAEPQRLDLGRTINLRIAEARAAGAHTTLERLRIRVRALYELRRPNLEASLTKYYLIRPEEEWHRDHPRITHDEAEAGQDCSICTAEFIEGDPYVLYPEGRGVYLRVHPGCAYSRIFIQEELAEQRIPIRIGIGTYDQREELPLTRADLLELGFNEDETNRWEVQTILAYLRELTVRDPRLPGDLPIYHMCPNVDDCSNPIFADRRDQHNNVTCEACAHQSCYLCEHASHPALTCAQAARGDQGADVHNPESGLRPCPYCLTPAAKDGGCNHVVCQNPACRREWHFIKGKLRTHSFTHDFNARDPLTGAEVVPPRLYRVRGDEGYIEGRDMECAFPAADGAIRN